MAHLFTGWALEYVIEIAESTSDIANLIRCARGIVLAINPAFPLRNAGKSGVIAGFIRVTRLNHRVRAIGEAQICFGIAPEVRGARVIRITRT